MQVAIVSTPRRFVALMVGIVSLAAASPESAADPLVPFKGTVTAGFLIVPSEDPEILIVNYTGTGQATHLGRFTVTAQYELEAENLLEFLTEPYVVEGIGFEFTAANGGQLVGSYTGYTNPTGVFGFVDIRAEATITAGTGRFEGVTGVYVTEGLVDVFGGASESTIVGAITRPGRGGH
jgi:hypothetical protein